MRALSLATAIALLLVAMAGCAALVPRGIAVYAHVQIPACVLAGLALGRPPRRLAAAWAAASLVASWAAAGMLFHASCDGAVKRSVLIGRFADNISGAGDTCAGIATAMRVLTNVLSGVLVVFLFYLALATMRDNLTATAAPARRRPQGTSSSSSSRPPPPAPVVGETYIASTPHWLFAVAGVAYLRPAMHFVVVPTTFWPMFAAFAFGLYAGKRTPRAIYVSALSAVAAAASAAAFAGGECYDEAVLVPATPTGADDCARDAYGTAGIMVLLAGSLAERSYSLASAGPDTKQV